MGNGKRRSRAADRVHWRDAVDAGDVPATFAETKITPSAGERRGRCPRGKNMGALRKKRKIILAK